MLKNFPNVKDVMVDFPKELPDCCQYCSVYLDPLTPVFVATLVEICHNKLSMNSFHLIIKKLQLNGFDPKISSLKASVLTIILWRQM